MSFSRAANPIWYFVNLTGQQLDDTYWIFFLTNTMPYLPQNVFQDMNGNTPWANPLQFNPNGTLPDNLYFNDELVYRLEIRKGPLQSDPLIYPINDFIPLGATPSNEENTVGEDNQISNAQFSEISFNDTLTITAAGTYEVAPGWSLTLTGSGTTILSQKTFTPLAAPPTPPYALEINNNGWTTAILFQRFNGIGAIYDGIDNNGGAIAASIVGKAIGTTENIAVSYVPNAGASRVIITSHALNTAVFTPLSNVINNPISDNPNLSNLDYIDIVITLPNTGTVQLSNVQFVGQNKPKTANPTLPAFQEETLERQQDHLFHYYANNLIIQPKKSLAVGWNFSLNPYQGFELTVATIALQTQYVADQIILHQEAASQVQTGQAAVAQRLGFEVIPVNASATTRFAIIQYIDPSSIRPYWSYILSSLMRARIFNEDGGTTPNEVRVKMRLIYRAGLPPTIGAAEPITGWDINSDITFSGGWTAIVPENDPAYILPNAYDTTTNSYPAFPFNNMQLPNTSNANMTLGIVLYTMDNMKSTAAHRDYIVFDKVSLVPGHFGSDADPQTFDECLRECQFYYEQSFPINGTTSITEEGVQYVNTPLNIDSGGSNYNLTRCPFSLNFRTYKRAIPSASQVVYYSNSVSPPNLVLISLFKNTASIQAVNDSTGNWTKSGFTNTGAVLIPALGTYVGVSQVVTSDSYQGIISYHYTVNVRLGT